MPLISDPGSGTFRLEGLFPNFHDETWVSYTLKSVLEGMRSDEIAIGATVLAKAPSVSASYVHPLCPIPRLSSVVYRFRDPVKSVFRAAGRRLNAGDVAYSWLTGPAELCRELSREGIMVAREMINCSMLRSRTELRKAYAALGEPDGSGITDEMIELERQDLFAADVIFCPNQFVKESVVDYGIPAEKCIETSYGWGADRLNTTGRVVPEDGVFTVAFVGTLDVRKGAPLLLKAWATAKIPGRLLLAGRMRLEEKRYQAVLSRPDVVRLGYVSDIGSVYRSADVLCFPSWEEGGPQVTFEAMSMGVVPVVTPMGTGGAFRQSDDVGIVVPPGDVEALSSALCALASDKERLSYLKNRARDRAAEYTWQRVGQRRREQLLLHRERWLRSR